MIRVIVNMVTHGKENASRGIGEVLIANDGSGEHTTGNYEYVKRTGLEEDIRVGRIEGHPRDEGWNVLLERVLSDEGTDAVLPGSLQEHLLNRMLSMPYGIQIDSTPKMHDNAKVRQAGDLLACEITLVDGQKVEVYKQPFIHPDRLNSLSVYWPAKTADGITGYLVDGKALVFKPENGGECVFVAFDPNQTWLNELRDYFYGTKTV